MKEYIERGALLENLSEFAPEHNTPLIQLLVTRQPPADVVEVTYCKDCIHRDPEDKKCDIFQGLCRGILPVKDTDFCSYGERKD